MKTKFQLYLSNPNSILEYGSKPSYSASADDKVSDYLTTEAGYIWLKEFELDAPELPKEVLLTKTVEAMRVALQKHRADAEVKATQMQQAINDLLMIEHKAS